jgi:hypothetical protein
MFQEDNIGQSIWDKMKCYWELFEEHIENLRNMLRTKWELGGELIGKNQNLTPHTHPEKKQNLDLLGACCNS